MRNIRIANAVTRTLGRASLAAFAFVGLAAFTSPVFGQVPNYYPPTSAPFSPLDGQTTANPTEPFLLLIEARLNLMSSTVTTTSPVARPLTLSVPPRAGYANPTAVQITEATKQAFSLATTTAERTGILRAVAAYQPASSPTPALTTILNEAAIIAINGGNGNEIAGYAEAVVALRPALAGSIATTLIGRVVNNNTAGNNSGVLAAGVAQGVFTDPTLNTAAVTSSIARSAVSATKFTPKTGFTAPAPQAANVAKQVVREIAEDPSLRSYLTSVVTGAVGGGLGLTTPPNRPADVTTMVTAVFTALNEAGRGNSSEAAVHATLASLNAITYTNAFEKNNVLAAAKAVSNLDPVIDEAFERYTQFRDLNLTQQFTPQAETLVQNRIAAIIADVSLTDAEKEARAHAVVAAASSVSVGTIVSSIRGALTALGTARANASIGATVIDAGLYFGSTNGGTVVRNAINSTTAPVTRENAVRAAMRSATNAQANTLFTTALSTIPAATGTGVTLSANQATEQGRVTDLVAATVDAIEAQDNAEPGRAMKQALIDVARSSFVSKKNYTNSIATTIIQQLDSPSDVANLGPAVVAAAMLNFGPITNSATSINTAVARRDSLIAAAQGARLDDNDDAYATLVNFAYNLRFTNSASNVQVTVDQTNAAIAANPTLVVPLIYAGSGAAAASVYAPLAFGASALRFKDSGVTKAEIVEAVLAHRKADVPNSRLAIDVAEQIIANNLETYEEVHHGVYNNRAATQQIVAAATAAVPQHAHRIARAAAYANPGAAQTTIGTIAAFMYQNAVNGERADGASGNPAAAAAVAAGAILGIKDAPRSSEAAQLAQLRGTAAAAVRAFATALSPTANFRQSDGGSGTFTPQQARGSAGVATGVVSQLTQVADTAVSVALGQIITSMVQAAANDFLHIAQAASQAIHSIVSDAAGFDTAGLSSAVFSALIPARQTTANQALINNAIAFGKSEAVAGRRGAGAAGIMDYAHSSGAGQPVSSLSGL